MKREDLTEKLLDIKREKGVDLEIHLREYWRLFRSADRRRVPRPDETDQAAGRERRRIVWAVEVRNSDAE
jgi:hypothetical protein